MNNYKSKTNEITNGSLLWMFYQVLIWPKLDFSLLKLEHNI